MENMKYRRTFYASCMGYVSQAIVNCFAPLLFLTFQSEFGIPISKITLLVTVNFSFQLVIDILSLKIVDLIGYKVSIIAANAFAAAGMLMLGNLPYLLPDAYTGLIIAVMFYAVGGGLLEVVISPIVEACPFDNKAGIMSLLHSFYSWGCVIVVLLSTAFFSAAGTAMWRVLACLWAVFPAVNALIFVGSPVPRLVPEGEGMSIGEIFKTKIIWLFFLLMICSGAAEQCMNQWASAFAEASLGISKTLGDLAGPCMFSVLMGTSRTIYGKLAVEDTIPVFIAGSGILCVISYLLASLGLHPAIALFGCALCGFSVGIMWPGVFSMASRSCPLGGMAMFSLLALGGDIGCDSGPTMAGLITSTAGSFNAGLLSGAVFPAVIVAGVIYLIRSEKKNGL